MFDLKQITETFKEDAKKILQKHKCLAPFVFFLTNKKNEKGQYEVTAMPLRFKDEQEKEKLAEVIKQAIKKLDAFAIITVMEGYMLKANDRKEMDKWIGKINKHPERVEVIFINGISRKEKIGYCVEFEKKDNEIIFKEETIVDNLGGRFADDLFEQAS